jgi:hypothetical protein
MCYCIAIVRLGVWNGNGNKTLSNLPSPDLQWELKWKYEGLKIYFIDFFSKTDFPFAIIKKSPYFIFNYTL